MTALQNKKSIHSTNHTHHQKFAKMTLRITHTWFANKQSRTETILKKDRREFLRESKIVCFKHLSLALWEETLKLMRAFESSRTFSIWWLRACLGSYSINRYFKAVSLSSHLKQINNSLILSKPVLKINLLKKTISLINILEWMMKKITTSKIYEWLSSS